MPQNVITKITNCGKNLPYIWSTCTTVWVEMRNEWLTVSTTRFVRNIWTTSLHFHKVCKACMNNVSMSRELFRSNALLLLCLTHRIKKRCLSERGKIFILCDFVCFFFIIWVKLPSLFFARNRWFNWMFGRRPFQKSVTYTLTKACLSSYTFEWGLAQFFPLFGLYFISLSNFFLRSDRTSLS